MGSQPLPERVTDVQARPYQDCQPTPTFLGDAKFLLAFPPSHLRPTLLHNVLSGPKVKGHTVTWTDSLLAAFNKCKASLSRTALLAHPDPSAPLVIVKDASTTAMGAVLQQQVQSVWQPLAFFSKKLSPA